MKLKLFWIPYILIIIFIPALNLNFGPLFGLRYRQWELILDILMAVTALAGLIIVLIRRKSHLPGGIPFLFLTILFILPQLYLWFAHHWGLTELRRIYRFVLLYLTLFIIPLNFHYTHKERLILIGCFCFCGLCCCAYELKLHPRVWEYSGLFSDHPEQIMSIFLQKNRFGAYLALWLILCIYAIYISDNYLWLIPGVIFFFFLLLTCSRGALLLLFTFVVCFIISFRKEIGMKNMLMILADILIVLVIMFLVPPVREFLLKVMRIDHGVSGRDQIWAASWELYREANPLIGHGMGIEIERILTERYRLNVSTHNTYLYILNCGGVCMMLLYILSFAWLLRFHCHKTHYLIPLLVGTIVYGFFELACAPFDYWHLSNMFTVCLFFIPATVIRNHNHTKLPIFPPEKEEEGIRDN